MIATLSTRIMTQLIRELEGIDPAVTEDEIMELLPRYANRLFQHLAEYGVRVTGQCVQRGAIADFTFTLAVIPSEENRELLAQGLALLRPLHITVESQDLPALVLNSAMQAGFRTAWPQIAPMLQRISAFELLEKIEQCAGIALRASAPYDEILGGGPQDPVAFAVWCQTNGLRVPDQDRSRREALAEQAAKELQRREREAIERTFRFDGLADFKVRE